MALEVIVGTMFSGKTSELITREERHALKFHKTQAFKHQIDTRYKGIASHDGKILDAVPVRSAHEIERCLTQETQAILIDEVHFFDSDIIDYSTLWAKDRTVIVAGILYDWRDDLMIFRDGKARVKDLVDLAKKVDLKKASCTYSIKDRKCGMPATKLQRFEPDGKLTPASVPVFQVGGRRYEQMDLVWLGGGQDLPGVRHLRRVERAASGSVDEN